MAFRILCLDGGGIRGAFTASVLASMERAANRSFVDHFDLMVGTSTGGIIALALSLGVSAESIRDFYIEFGPRIFPGTGLSHRFWQTLRQLFTAKRSHEALRQALGSVFGERPLSDARCRVVVATYDAVAGRIALLKTAHHPRLVFEHQALAVDCALATSAAPTYFRAAEFPLHPGASYVDGGVWANCPVLVGVIEALHFLKVPIDQIEVLSIGTVGEPFSVSRSRRLGGLVQWNAGIVELLMRGQLESALAQSRLLLPNGVHRIDALVQQGRFSLDDAGAVSDLVALGDGEARKKSNLEVVLSRFLCDPLATPFVPAVRADAPPHAGVARSVLA